jgi:hypothetical protein
MSLAPTPLHRLPFAPVWIVPGTQQEAFWFEDDEPAEDEALAAGL